jgi:hypothetical protein
VKILYVKSEDSNFKTELIQKDSGSNYVIRVTPIETELDMATVIWIKTDFLLGNRNKYIRGYAKIVN